MFFYTEPHELEFLWKKYQLPRSFINYHGNKGMQIQKESKFAIKDRLYSTHMRIPRMGISSLIRWKRYRKTIEVSKIVVCECVIEKGGERRRGKIARNIETLWCRFYFFFFFLSFFCWLKRNQAIRGTKSN